MDISDRLGNFALLRGRLETAENTNALMQLDQIRMNAFNEFRELTKPGKTITVDGETFTDEKQRSMSDGEREWVVFSLGWECLKSATPVARDSYFDHDITLHHLGILPHCAMLHVLVMLENMSIEVQQVIPFRFNFYLVDDINNMFKDLVAMLPLFYPLIIIGKVDLVIPDGIPPTQDVQHKDSLIADETRESNNAPVEISDRERKALLSSQLLARYHFMGDIQSLEEFQRRMKICGISKEKADALMENDIEIISRLDKRFLTDPNFIKSWFFTSDRKKLKANISEYAVDKELTTSEITKIFDEANWHIYNDRYLADGVLAEILTSSQKAKEPILLAAVTILSMLGWSFGEANRYLYNENLLISNVRWGYETAQVPYTPGVDHPASAKIKQYENEQSRTAEHKTKAEKNVDHPINESQDERHAQSNNQKPKETQFMKYANMKRRGETLPDHIKVDLQPTPKGGVFSVTVSYDDGRIEIYECNENGRGIHTTYGGSYIRSTPNVDDPATANAKQLETAQSGTVERKTTAVKCENNHFYDAARFDQCPYCKPDSPITSFSGSINTKGNEENKNISAFVELFERELRRKRSVYLNLALLTGVFVLAGLIGLTTSNANLSTGFLIIGTPLFVLFLWLFIRIGKDIKTSTTVTPSTTVISTVQNTDDSNSIARNAIAAAQENDKIDITESQTPTAPGSRTNDQSGANAAAEPPGAEPDEDSGADIISNYFPLISHMYEHGNIEALEYLERMRMKAFDDLRYNGNDIIINFDGRNGLISNYLTFLEPEEKERLIGRLGHLLTEYTDSVKGETIIYQADKLPNCAMIALIVKMADGEDKRSADKKATHTFRVITDGNDEKYSEFTGLLKKLPLVITHLEPVILLEQGDIPLNVSLLFREQKEITIDLNEEHIDFLFIVKEISPIYAGTVYFKGEIFKGSVKPKDILAVTDNKGKMLAQGCPVTQTLIGENKCDELSKSNAEEVGLVVGVYLKPGEYSNGLVLIRSEVVEAMQSPKVHFASKMLAETQKRLDAQVAAVEEGAKYLSDSELQRIFYEYFAPNMEFYMHPGSPKYLAYFNAINTATVEMLENPGLYYKATKREWAELVKMNTNRIPGLTNQLICGLIFCMGKYAVVPSSMLSADFAKAIPNCIAVYLLLTAQKLPVGERKQRIDAGDGVNKKPLQSAMDALSVCDPNWSYHIY